MVLRSGISDRAREDVNGNVKRERVGVKPRQPRAGCLVYKKKENHKGPVRNFLVEAEERSCFRVPNWTVFFFSA